MCSRVVVEELTEYLLRVKRKLTAGDTQWIVLGRSGRWFGSGIVEYGGEAFEPACDEVVSIGLVMEAGDTCGAIELVEVQEVVELFCEAGVVRVAAVADLPGELEDVTATVVSFHPVAVKQPSGVAAKW